MSCNDIEHKFGNPGYIDLELHNGRALGSTSFGDSNKRVAGGKTEK